MGKVSDNVDNLFEQLKIEENDLLKANPKVKKRLKKMIEEF